MFATGVLAHSLLLPLIGILVQMFVVNYWFVGTEEKPSISQNFTNTISISQKSSSFEANAAYNFSNYFTEKTEEQKAEVKDDPSIILFLPFLKRICNEVTHPYYLLRAPPVH